jgi:hypothetical protein
MVGCLVEFVKGFCILENIGVFLVLLLSVPKKLYVESLTYTYHRCIPPEPNTTVDSLSTMVVVNLYDNIVPDPTSITSPQRLNSCKLAGSSPPPGTQIGRKSKSASLQIGRKKAKKLQTSRLTARRFGKIRRASPTMASGSLVRHSCHKIYPPPERLITVGLACSLISIYVGMLVLQCSSF